MLLPSGASRNTTLLDSCPDTEVTVEVGKTVVGVETGSDVGSGVGAEAVAVRRAMPVRAAPGISTGVEEGVSIIAEGDVGSNVGGGGFREISFVRYFRNS